EWRRPAAYAPAAGPGRSRAKISHSPVGARSRAKAFATKVAPTRGRLRGGPDRVDQASGRGSALAREGIRDQGRSHKRGCAAALTGRISHPAVGARSRAKTFATNVAPTSGCVAAQTGRISHPAVGARS